MTSSGVELAGFLRQRDFAEYSGTTLTKRIEQMKDEMNSAEAIYGFAGWLTNRKEKTVMGSSYDVAPIAELIEQFCIKNNLTKPRERWEYNLIHPGT